VTLVSKKTGARFTYKLKASDDEKAFFVGVLTGNDNETSYSYLGRIARRPGGEDVYFHGRKNAKYGDISRDAPSAVAFQWTWNALTTGRLPSSLEIYHSGSCGRCGRKLTVPESILSGLGPECAGKV
jgi:hypothetical protein